MEYRVQALVFGFAGLCWAGRLGVDCLISGVGLAPCEQ